MNIRLYLKTELVDKLPRVWRSWFEELGEVPLWFKKHRVGRRFSVAVIDKEFLEGILVKIEARGYGVKSSNSGFIKKDDQWVGRYQHTDELTEDEVIDDLFD